jgi:hypothetical protein
MNNAESLLNESKRTSPVPLLKKEHGLFNCSTINCSPARVFSFCKEAGNVEKILSDLPLGTENFLNLNLISSDQNASGVYQVQWENKPDSKATGTLIFNFKAAPMNRGTILAAEAVFDNFKIKDDEPSLLMNIFLKRMKSLLETGEIATTKGQPSGRDEISAAQDKNKYH